MKAVIVALVLIPLAGCASLRPDYVTAGAVHQSQPGYGPGPWPFGDDGRTRETTLDAVEVGAEWTRGRVYASGAVGYSVTHELDAGRWFTTLRVGYRMPLP